MSQQPTFGRSRTHASESTGGSRIITPRDLPNMGIAYHINHLRRMWTAGRFPKPFHLSARRLAWREEDIRQWIEARVAATSAQRSD